MSPPGGGNWILQTRSGRLDVMQWVEPFSDYRALRAQGPDRITSLRMARGIEE